MKGKLKMNKKWGHFVKAEGESDTVVVLPICMFAHPFCEKKQLCASKIKSAILKATHNIPSKE